MRTALYALTLLALADLGRAQFSVARPMPLGKALPPVSGPTTVPGSFLMGSDNCASAHTLVPPGPQASVPFTTGTTGSQGQSEANCYAFGSTSIANDVWFDWQATATGNATMTTCASGIDTKIAAWPLNAGACPANGTSLACNDDACGLQSAITWTVVSGTSYTLQLGTFPGASGGSGTFNTTQQAPPPCGRYDDGTTENALGLTAGGDLGWLHNQECLLTVDSIDTAYGTPLGGLVPNGNASTIVSYEDTDCDRNPTTPAAGMVLMWSVATVVTNADTDILNHTPRVGGTAIASSQCTWVMATAVQAAGQFPAPLDHTNPTPKAWVVGQTTSAGGILDIDNLNANNLPPLQLQATGFPAAWLLRANGSSDTDPGTEVCFGDGSGSPCPCGNTGAPGNGCAGGPGNGGHLTASGNCGPSQDTLIFTGTNLDPGGLAFLITGTTLLNGGNGLPFYDGLRCIGGLEQNFGPQLPSFAGTATWGPGIGALGRWPIGGTQAFQILYRTPTQSPCGTQLNWTNAYQMTMACEGTGDPCAIPCDACPPVLARGDDSWQSALGAGSTVDFSASPIPAGFFYPGSAAYTGLMQIQGEPLNTDPPGALGSADTIVRRLADTQPLSVGQSDTVPIEIVALNLVSAVPILVTGSQPTQAWDVRVCLTMLAPQDPGSITIRRLCPDGGEFDSALPIKFKFIFTRPSPPTTLVIDPLTVQFQSTNSDWTIVAGPNCLDPDAQGLDELPPGVGIDCDGDLVVEAVTIGSSNFRAGIEACGTSGPVFPCGITMEQALLNAHGVGPSGDADGDSWPDCSDNCPNDANPEQLDCDGDGFGDVCDGLRATLFCFCDGTGSGPPCGNYGAPRSGCRNSVGASAQLTACGMTFPDTVDLQATGARPNQPGLFFQGNAALNGGDGFVFGDGLRCVGITVIRLAIVVSDPAGVARYGPGSGNPAISSITGVEPGETKRYQFWYRDPPTGACLNGFNLSSALEIAW